MIFDSETVINNKKAKEMLNFLFESKRLKNRTREKQTMNVQFL